MNKYRVSYHDEFDTEWIQDEYIAYNENDIEKLLDRDYITDLNIELVEKDLIFPYNISR